MKMTLPTAINYQALTTAIRSGILNTYKAKSLLAFFPSVNIPKGITAEKWAQRYLKETKRAALHGRGFNPNTITMDYSGFELPFVTIDQQAILSEIDLAQFQQMGLLPSTVNQIGYDMAYTSNTYLMMHQGGNGEGAPNSDYHYILATGSGNGTVERPNPYYDANSAGAWGTLSNAFADVSRLKGEFIAHGGDLASHVLLIPRAAAPGLQKIRNEYQDRSVENYLQLNGLNNMVYIDDEFFKTVGSSFATLPTVSAFDMVLLDASKVIVGYQRPESVNSYQGTGVDHRNYYIEGEVWFSTLMEPILKRYDGTDYVYKAMTRIRGVDAS